MSRIAKKPVTIPEGVTAKCESGVFDINGPKGSLSFTPARDVAVAISAENITVTAKNNSKRSRSISGLTRTLFQNMVTGVTEGYTKVLEMKGVGYRAEVVDQNLILHVGFSHPVEFAIPKGINIEVKKNTINLDGIDKQLVGETAARIRRIKPPEPYKGKGIKYSDEIIRRKVGKAAKAAEGASK